MVGIPRGEMDSRRNGRVGLDVQHLPIHPGPRIRDTSPSLRHGITTRTFTLLNRKARQSAVSPTSRRRLRTALAPTRGFGCTGGHRRRGRRGVEGCVHFSAEPSQSIQRYDDDTFRIGGPWRDLAPGCEHDRSVRCDTGIRGASHGGPNPPVERGRRTCYYPRTFKVSYAPRADDRRSHAGIGSVCQGLRSDVE